MTKTRKIRFNKFKLTKYHFLIKQKLIEQDEILIYDDLLDLFSTFRELENSPQTTQQMMSKFNTDEFIDKMLFIKPQPGYTIQKIKQETLEKLVKNEIKMEKNEEHMKRFTRGYRKKQNMPLKLTLDESVTSQYIEKPKNICKKLPHELNFQLRRVMVPMTHDNERIKFDE